MARATSTRTRGARGAKKPSGVRVDLSNISKAFEAGQEYAIRVVECTLEEGTKAPYFNLKLSGLVGSEFENSVMYHRASTGEASLWRLRPLLEAFGFEIPDGPLDLEAEDFIDREAMCSTYLDRYEGGSSVKPDEFWPLEESEGAADGDAADFDLDDLTDEEVDAVAEALEVKGRTTAAKKKALAKLDLDDVEEAYKGLDSGETDTDEGDAAEFDLDELSDEDLMALADHMGVKAKTPNRAKTALSKEDEDEVLAAWEELQEEKANQKGKAAGKEAGKAGKKSGPDPVTEDEIQEMNEDELEKVVEDFELDLDLSDHKTLRKMKNAVIDAMEEGNHFA